MIIFIKEIILKFFTFFGKVSASSKDKIVLFAEGKAELSPLVFDLKEASVDNVISQITTVSESKEDVVSDIIEDGDNQVDNTGPIVIPDLTDEDKTFVRKINVGFGGFGIPLDTRSIRLATGSNKGEYYNFAPSASNYNDLGERSKLLFSNIFYKNIEDPDPIPYEELYDYIAIIKNNQGKAFFPQWNFSGIQGLANGEALQIKAFSEFYIKVTGKPNKIVSSVDEFDLSLSLPPGSTIPENKYSWEMITCPFMQPVDIKEYFGERITDFHFYKEAYTSSTYAAYIADVQIMKDTDGKAVWPIWDFYYFKTLEPGKLYQINANFSRFGSVGDHTYKSGH